MVEGEGKMGAGGVEGSGVYVVVGKVREPGSVGAVVAR